jgi:hypothetical protein
MRKNKESYVEWGGVFGLAIIKHVTLQKIVAHDFRYDLRILLLADSFIIFRFYFYQYMIVFLFNTVIYVFLLLRLCILIVQLP